MTLEILYLLPTNKLRNSILFPVVFFDVFSSFSRLSSPRFSVFFSSFLSSCVANDVVLIEKISFRSFILRIDWFSDIKYYISFSFHLMSSLLSFFFFTALRTSFSMQERVVNEVKKKVEWLLGLATMKTAKVAEHEDLKWSEEWRETTLKFLLKYLSVMSTVNFIIVIKFALCNFDFVQQPTGACAGHLSLFLVPFDFKCYDFLKCLSLLHFFSSPLSTLEI